MMNADAFTRKLSEKTGLKESMVHAMVKSVVSHMTRQAAGACNISSEGWIGVEGIRSALSNIHPLTSEHPLVERISHDTGVNDLQQIVEHTQLVIDMLNEETRVHPENVHTLFSTFLAALS